MYLIRRERDEICLDERIRFAVGDWRRGGLLGGAGLPAR
jgi:hypothetical protein